jgi:hypothetical protein
MFGLRARVSDARRMIFEQISEGLSTLDSHAIQAHLQRH